MSRKSGCSRQSSTPRRSPPSSPSLISPRRSGTSTQSSAAKRSGLSSPSSEKSVKRKSRKSKGNFFHLMLEGEKSGSVPLADMRRSEIMSKVDVPGQKKTLGPNLLNFMSQMCPYKGMNIMKALKNFIFSMKGQGVSLKGKFSLDNLVWIPRTKQVKVKKVKEEEFVKFKTKFGERAEGIQELFDGYRLPHDLVHWIFLLKKSPYSNKYLIQNHIALMSANDKLHHFIYLYELLEQLKKQRDILKQMKGSKNEVYQETKKFDAIYRGVPSRDTETGYDWRGHVSSNEYLLQIFDFKTHHYPGSGDASLLLDLLDSATMIS